MNYQFAVHANQENENLYSNFIKDIGNSCIHTKSGKQELVHIVLGGDGSLNYFINNKLNEKNVKLLYFPLGTANDFAKSLKLEKKEPTLAKVKEILDFHHLTHVPLVKCNHLYFINALVIGTPARVTDSASTLLKKVSGKLSYHLNAIKELITNESFQIKIKTHRTEKTINTQGLIVAQGLYAGGGAKITSRRYPALNKELSLTAPKNSELTQSIPEIIKMQNFDIDGEEIDLVKLYEESFNISFNIEAPAKIDGEEIKSKTYKINRSKKSIQFFNH